MYLAIDIILVVVMAATLIKAVKRGFVVSLFSLLTVAVSVIAAMMFYKELGVYINDRFVYKPIEEYVSGLFESAAAQNGGVLDADAITAVLPEGLRGVIGVLNIKFDDILSGLFGSINDMAEEIALKISTSVSNILAFVTLFFAAFIALGIICFVLDIFAKLPVLHGINKIFGFLLGAVQAFVLGVLIAKVALAVCGIYGTLNNDAAFLDVAEKTVVAKFLVSIFPW